MSLFSQGGHQIGLVYPAIREKDITKPDIFALPKRRRRKQIGRIDRVPIQQDFSQRWARGAVGVSFWLGIKAAPSERRNGIRDWIGQQQRRRFGVSRWCFQKLLPRAHAKPRICP
ncbi:hypothetical protein [Thioclava sp. F42-5]|uniref:hypothetical protein n=1 Tax=Thioclava sp. F42-5 TaxID=1973005 RepID=UPI001F0B6841|nr:hypothetical protein [Thioclava sp. F42-5]